MLKQLMNTEETDIDRSAVGTVNMYPLKRIKRSAEQARKLFDDEQLNELAQSIREHGVLQPMVIRSDGMLVAGERRYRACKLAGLIEAPVIVRDVEDSKESYLLGLIENLQRVDLNPIEEAQAYGVLRDQHNLTQEQIAAQVGKSRPAVANALRLLKLPGTVQEMVMDGKLSAGHANELLVLGDRAEEIKRLAADCISSEWSVIELRHNVDFVINRTRQPAAVVLKKAYIHPDEALDVPMAQAIRQQPDNSEIAGQARQTGDGGLSASNARPLPPPSSIWSDFEEVAPTATAPTQEAPVTQPAAQTAQVEEAPEMFVDEQVDTEQPEAEPVVEFQKGSDGAIMTFHDGTVLAEVAGVSLDFSNVNSKFLKYRVKIVIELVDKAGEIIADEVVIGMGDCQ